MDLQARYYEELISPLSEEELNRIIDEAEKDSLEERLTSAVELKREIDLWD